MNKFFLVTACCLVIILSTLSHITRVYIPLANYVRSSPWQQTRRISSTTSFAEIVAFFLFNFILLLLAVIVVAQYRIVLRAKILHFSFAYSFFVLFATQCLCENIIEREASKSERIIPNIVDEIWRKRKNIIISFYTFLWKMLVISIFILIRTSKKATFPLNPLRCCMHQGNYEFSLWRLYWSWFHFVLLNIFSSYTCGK